MEQTTEQLAPVTKRIEVPLEPEAAFDLFTAGMAQWWPMVSHSVSQSPTAMVRVEGHVGGGLVETDDEGREHLWGSVTEWDRPSTVAFTWHPGRGAETAQSVTVSFAAAGAGTRVDLEHRGWERIGEFAAKQREAYEEGWNPVLDRYRELAAERPTS